MVFYRRAQRVAVAVAVVAALALAGCGADADPREDSDPGDNAAPPPATGAADPTDGSTDEGSVETPEQLEFSLPTVAGDTFAGADLLGTPSVLWFWAPWCAVCANQAPQVSALADQYGDDADVVGVAGLDPSVDAMADFVDRTGVDNLPHLVDLDGQVWQQFEITAQSTFAVLDADGSVVQSGSINPDDLASHLDDLGA